MDQHRGYNNGGVEEKTTLYTKSTIDRTSETKALDTITVLHSTDHSLVATFLKMVYRSYTVTSIKHHGIAYY